MIPQDFLQQRAKDLDITLRQIVSTVPDDVPGLGVMLRYPLGWVDQNDRPYGRPTGKRIRPLLLLLCAESADGDWHKALPAAAAIELLHNFSLVHDDIQDNSPTRHGRPTVWKIWGRSNAVNVGDALFSLAHVALEKLSETGISADTVLEVWHIFNQTTLKLTRGQHLDMRFESQAHVTIDDYLAMIEGKSAALLSASAQIGVMIAINDKDAAFHYAEFALNLGMAFQIRDDILGIWGDPNVTGKSAATDILARKKSLPILYGLSKSEELVAIYANEVIQETDVERAAEILDRVGAEDYVLEEEARYSRLATEFLEAADPKGEAATQLLKLVDDLLMRNR